MLSPAYESQKYEDAIYKAWENSGAFKAKPNSGKKPFTISMPPPNATGTLHLGHAVMLALEDILTRHRRMKGYEALWVPGTDHAAIATENVVIRKLRDEGMKDPRKELGREKLVGKIAEFVDKSRDTIRGQVRKMGASCDWSRERYTFDPALNRCVNEIFKRMYDDGLIYRGHRIVNWDPKLQTTVSDDEVDYKEEKAPFFTFKYGPFEISTSRPETKFGDKYVVMHPEDERYKKYKHGDTFEAEWINGKVKATVIKDKSVDPKFGTGVMTITPWHDAIDFDIAERHKLEKEQIIDFNGKLLPIAGEFSGMSIHEARPLIVEKLKNKGLLVKIDENYVHNKALNSRGGGAIEPQIKLQWFIDVNKKAIRWGFFKKSLKQVMQTVVKKGDIEIIPEKFNKTYFHWIDNLKDWCISRQIWWGHRVPVWYKEGQTYCGIKAPEGEGWSQDPDTLDTWFSSALWTWSTLVDPKKATDLNLDFKKLLKESEDLKFFHPTSVMETGYDILFFWVARMILMTTYALKEVPFKTVYLHGLIRTRDGKKMSKSDPSTCIDPLDMIATYGADALRMSMVIGNTPGNDMSLYEEKIKGYRNFTNKLWNAARFVLTITEEKGIKEIPTPEIKSAADEWILGKLDTVTQRTDENLMNFRISEAGQDLYHFLWDDFCDWYLELSKGDKQNPGVLLHVLKNILILLHPFTPFVTEEIWKNLPGSKGMLIHESYSKISGKKWESKATDQLIEVITKIRYLRAENRIEPALKIPATLYAGNHLKTLKENEGDLARLARISELTLLEKGEKIKNAATGIAAGIEIFVPLTGLVDPAKEKERVQKEIITLEKYISGLKSKLANESFVKNAPAKIIEDEKGRLKEAEEKLVKLKSSANA